MVPKENENNAYAKFVGTNKEYYGIFRSGLLNLNRLILRTVPTIVIAHTFCASPNTRISYRQCLPIQVYFCAV